MTNFTRIAILFMMVSATSRITAAELPDISTKSNRILVCSHRANYGDLPENSLAAIEACIKGGVDMIEIDVAKTKDGKLVLMHDATVNRTTNGKGAIKDLTLAELKKLRLLGRGKKKEVTDETVPTLKEVLELCKGRIYVNLDMKGVSIFDCEDVIKATGTESVIMYRATSVDWLKRVAKTFPKMILSPYVNFQKKDGGWPKKGTTLKLLEPYSEAGIDVWGVHLRDINHPSASKENLQALNKKGIRAWKMTMWGKYSDKEALKNPAKVWGPLIDLGYSVIMTDEPEALITYLKTIKRH